ncbi:hypothetical protein J1G43_14465 [Cellulomonas sp. zg-ZUI22]|uniref:hypothetical protein n=1 Tax=Cellulomonas sp. zg-ZUI22 TaxID=2816955 RepID=UPI001A94DBA8|nr:hypothetical protein [Cellulomonas sp. zg-ZUI22]MBO0901166.1 hypothetical protein [Cellulomonas sp. zg-ZUI22]
MKQYVLVAGVDYEFKGVDFRVIADRRRAWLERRNTKKEDLRFVTMDVRSGEVQVRTVTFAGGRRTEAVTATKAFTPVTRASYATSGGHTRFKPNQPGVMGITDVFHRVVTIGAISPGTVMELSIFSHGWMGGPILVNSTDDRTHEVAVPMPIGPPVVTLVPVAGTSRDPDDKDGRSGLDFRAPTMDTADLDSFRKAFHTDGISWLWGCAFPKVVNHSLWAMQHAPTYRSSGLAEDTVLRLDDVTPDDVASLEDVLHPLLGTFPSRQTITLKFGFLRWAFCAKNQSSYAVALAAATQRPVRAALLGTYAEYDTTGDMLMNVPAKFGAHFAFYKNYLGLPLDPEGRRYGVYPPALVCAPAPAP